MWLCIAFSFISTSAGAYVILGNFEIPFIPEEFNKPMRIFVSLFTAVLVNIGLGFIIDSSIPTEDEKKNIKEISNLKIQKSNLEEDIKDLESEIKTLSKKDPNDPQILIKTEEIKELKKQIKDKTETINDKEREVGIVFGGYNKVTAPKPINNSNLIGGLATTTLIIIFVAGSLLLSLVGLNKSYKDYQINSKLKQFGYSDITKPDAEFNKNYVPKSSNAGGLLLNNINGFKGEDDKEYNKVIDVQKIPINNTIANLNNNLTDLIKQRDSFNQRLFGQNQIYKDILNKITNQQNDITNKQNDITKLINSTPQITTRQKEAIRLSNILNNVTLDGLHQTGVDNFMKSFSEADALLAQIGNNLLSNSASTINKTELEKLVKQHKILTDLNNEDRFFDFLSVADDLKSGGLSLNNVYFIILFLLAMIGDFGPLLIFLRERGGNLVSDLFYNLGLFFVEILEDIKNIIWWVLTWFVSLISIKPIIEHFKKGAEGVALIPTFVSSIQEFFFGNESIPNTVARNLYEVFRLTFSNRWFGKFLEVTRGFLFIFMLYVIPLSIGHFISGGSWNNLPVLLWVKDFYESMVSPIFKNVIPPVVEFGKSLQLF